MTTLAGRYRLEEVIGRGGMSTVYRATDRVLQRTVAVKVMSAALAEGDPSTIARFEREARAAASLVHPGIVTVYDTGVDGDQRFIAMEYIDGESLATIIAREAPLAPDRVTRIGAEAADALDAAHRAGLVHRDVKPGNVMIARTGVVKVLDFGIARVGDAASITKTTSLLGTAAYMPPEHALGEPVDARSDVYSLGCLLYAMLTGHPPFSGEVPAAVLHQQVNATPRPPSEVNGRVSRELDALVLQMLAKAPADRPQSAAEVRDRLRGAPAPASVTPAAARMDPTAATEMLGAAQAPVPVAARPTPARAPESDDGGGGASWVRFVIGLLAIALVALIAALALATGGGAPSSSQSTSTTPPARSTTSRSSTTQSTPTHSTTTVTPTTTVTVTTPASTTATTPPTTPAQPVPPGQGGTPPGKAKKAPKAKKGGG
jgi:eukaryotic-like serine/threonine-protein kinase